MKIFLDANVIVSVLNREYPLFTYSSRILSLTERYGYEVCTSPICLAIAVYFAEKKCGTKRAKEKMVILSEHLSIIETNRETVSLAASNPKVLDFEDGLEYYSALQYGCQAVITEDVEDFYFSELPVYDCRRFIGTIR